MQKPFTPPEPSCRTWREKQQYRAGEHLGLGDVMTFRSPLHVIVSHTNTPTYLHITPLQLLEWFWFWAKQSLGAGGALFLQLLPHFLQLLPLWTFGQQCTQTPKRAWKTPRVLHQPPPSNYTTGRKTSSHSVLSLKEVLLSMPPMVAA